MRLTPAHAAATAHPGLARTGASSVCHCCVCDLCNVLVWLVLIRSLVLVSERCWNGGEGRLPACDLPSGCPAARCPLPGPAPQKGKERADEAGTPRLGRGPRRHSPLLLVPAPDSSEAHEIVKQSTTVRNLRGVRSNHRHHFRISRLHVSSCHAHRPQAGTHGCTIFIMHARGEVRRSLGNT